MRIRFGFHGARLATAAAVTLSVAGCQTPTPYQPLAANARSAGGYTDQQIEPNRFRVTFSGNAVTSRETVETYLLYRAAQLTVDRGFDWFEMADRATERNTNTYATQPFGPGPYGYWGPSWRYSNRDGPWREWDPNWGNPFWAGAVNVTTVNRYEAAAEIVMRRGPKPADNVRAFDARTVVANLAPRLQTPR
jgi:hypothetical protein